MKGLAALGSILKHDGHSIMLEGDCLTYVILRALQEIS
jgi:hypothetical protein